MATRDGSAEIGQRSGRPAVGTVDIGIVVDTISEDFAAALDLIAAWGIGNIELYHLWDRAVTDLDAAQTAEAVALVRVRGPRVTNIASLVMRCEPTDAAEAENRAMFERAVRLGRALGTDRIRCYAYKKQPDLDALWPRLGLPGSGKAIWK